MISTSTKYKQQLIAGNRRYVAKVNLTLADNTTLLLTNEELWEQGVVISNGISDESSFEIGSAIIGSLTLIIDNIKGNYNSYDFLNARAVLWLGVEGDTDLNDDQVYYRIGFYVVDNTSYNGSLITLNCLDNMTWFDVPFSAVAGITYPCTAGELVADICAHVGVTLGVAHFQNYTMTIPAEPDGEYNCREILSYVAQKCCCYCKINTAGELILTWYDKNAIIGITNYDGGTYNTNTTPYSDGCNLDGGSFMSGGDNADGGTFAALQQGAWLTNNFDMNVDTDDIVVTGCRVRQSSGEDTYDELWTDAILELDHPRYVLVIENNPFITSTDAAATANTIGNILAGLPIRGFSSRSLSDFSYETGDMVTIIDFRGNLYHTWITNCTFTIGNSETFSCGVESLKERNETRFSESAKTLVEADANASALITDYDRAVQAMNELAQNALGYNRYDYELNGATYTWLYNGSTVDTTDAMNPTFPSSTVVFKISGDGVFISHDGGLTYDQGYDANSGTAILSLMYAVGISADWIKTGTLDVGGVNNIDGVIHVVNRDTIATITVDGSDVSKGFFVGPAQVSMSGTYKVHYAISNVEVGKTEKIMCMIMKRYLDGGSYSWHTIIPYYDVPEHTGTLPCDFEVDKSDGDTYYYVYFSRSLATNASFDVTSSYDKINTVIDNQGITTSNINITGGGININNKFKVDSTGKLTAEDGTIAGLTINLAEKGWEFNGQISGADHYFKLTAWGGITCGCLANNSWQRMDYVTGYGMLKVDYANTSSSLKGFVATGAGNNTYYDPGSSYAYMIGDGVHVVSDRRSKKDITDLSKTLCKNLVLNARPVRYKFREGENKYYHYGFIAQEVEELIPENNSVIEYVEEVDRYSMNYQELIAPMLKMIQIQQEEIDALKAEVAELKARIE